MTRLVTDSPDEKKGFLVQEWPKIWRIAVHKITSSLIDWQSTPNSFLPSTVLKSAYHGESHHRLIAFRLQNRGNPVWNQWTVYQVTYCVWRLYRPALFWHRNTWCPEYSTDEPKITCGVGKPHHSNAMPLIFTKSRRRLGCLKMGMARRLTKHQT